MPFKEFFSDLKDKSWPRLYLTIMMSRRAIFAILLIMGKDLCSICLVIPLILIQALYLTHLIIIRPFKEIGDNLLEIINELFYSLLITLLVHFNSVSRWTKSVESLYLFLIIANSFWSVLLIISKISIWYILGSILVKLQYFAMFTY